jgi:hypothetical protein
MSLMLSMMSLMLSMMSSILSMTSLKPFTDVIHLGHFPDFIARRAAARGIQLPVPASGTNSIKLS